MTSITLTLNTAEGNEGEVWEGQKFCWVQRKLSSMSINHSPKSWINCIFCQKITFPFNVHCLYRRNNNKKGRNYFSPKYLSFSMNFLKSFWGGLGSKLMQEHRESSSEPNPVYGGIGFSAFGGDGALYGTGVKSSIIKTAMFIWVFFSDEATLLRI